MILASTLTDQLKSLDINKIILIEALLIYASVNVRQLKLVFFKDK